MDEPKTYFCPRGCNVFTTFEIEPECGACGCKMTTDPTEFDDVHEMNELEGIGTFEDGD